MKQGGLFLQALHAAWGVAHAVWDIAGEGTRGTHWAPEFSVGWLFVSKLRLPGENATPGAYWDPKTGTGASRSDKGRIFLWMADSGGIFGGGHQGKKNAFPTGAAPSDVFV